MGEPVRLVVHGHFYQPPRENPWTEVVGRERGAAPFHDWNERIASECYRPNGRARIVDDHNRILAIVDNYERISFNMGPTLLSWLKVWAPDAYRQMLRGDDVGGGAIAQAFSHSILPLAVPDEIRTQVRWGLADFRHRFGRPAEGMWLPECAVDDTVLAILAEEGVRFTILAPGQAAAVRPLDDDDGVSWTDVSGGDIDTRRPYRWLHPDGSGRGVDIVFYNGGLSHSLAFGLGLLSSQAFADQVRAAAGDGGGLVAVATDGETFGHHHAYGERLLAHALTVAAPAIGVEVTTAAQVLRDTPPEHEVRVRTSAWSCAHGVGRWKENCGCSTGGEEGWNQEWRGPLRAALDIVRDALLEVWDRRGADLLADRGAALDDYVDVIIGARTLNDFCAQHVVGDRRAALTLLEARRHAMAMYTSCGWFFNDLAGIETVQVLRYAARVLELIDELGEQAPRSAFFVQLDAARSNVADEGTGVQIWARHVEPVQVGPTRVVAHVALLDLLKGRRVPERVGPWAVELEDHRHADRGGSALCSGRARVTHARTGAVASLVYAALRIGGLEVIGCMRGADPQRDALAFSKVRSAFEDGAPITTMLRLVSDGFGPAEFGIDDALPDAAGEIFESAASALADRFAQAYAQLVEDHRGTLAALTAAGYPLPQELRVPAELALARRLETEVAEASRNGEDFDPVSYATAVEVAAEARRAGLSLDTPAALATIDRLLDESVGAACGGVEGSADVAISVLRLAEELGIHPDVDAAQERVYETLVAGGGGPALRLLGVALHLAVETLGVPSA